MKLNRTLFLFGVIILCTTISACGGDKETERAVRNQHKVSRSDLSASTAPMPEKVKVKTGSQLLVSIKAKDYGYKVMDENGQILAKIKRDGDRFKVKKEDGTKLFKIKPKEGFSFKLSDYSGNTLVKVKQKASGWTIRDKSDNTIAVIKNKDGKWLIQDPAGNSMGRVKARDGKCKIEGEADLQLFSVSDPLPSPAVAVFAVEKIPLLQRCCIYCWFREKIVR